MEPNTLEISKRLSDFLSGTKKLHIGGQWVESATGKTFNSMNPATGEVLATVFEAGEEDDNRVVDAARKAFDNVP